MGSGASAEKYKVEIDKREEALQKQITDLQKTVDELKEQQKGFDTTIDSLSALLTGGKWYLGRKSGDTSYKSLGFGKTMVVADDETDGTWSLSQVGAKLVMTVAWSTSTGNLQELELIEFEDKGKICFKVVLGTQEVGYTLFNVPGAAVQPSHWRLQQVELTGAVDEDPRVKVKPVVVFTENFCPKVGEQEAIPGSYTEEGEVQSTRYNHIEGHFRRGRLVKGTFLALGAEPKPSDAVGVQRGMEEGQQDHERFEGRLFIGCARASKDTWVFGKVIMGVCIYPYEDRNRRTCDFQYVSVDVEATMSSDLDPSKVEIHYTAVPPEFPLPTGGEQFILKKGDEHFELYCHCPGNHMCWSGCCSEECAFWYVDHVDADGAFQIRMAHHGGIAITVDSIEEGARVRTCHGAGTMFTCRKSDTSDEVTISTKENPTLFIGRAEEEDGVGRCVLMPRHENRELLELHSVGAGTVPQITYDFKPSGFPLPCAEPKGKAMLFMLKGFEDFDRHFELFCHEAGNPICWSHCRSPECAHWYVDDIDSDGAFRLKLPHHGGIAVKVESLEEGAEVKTTVPEEGATEGTMFVCERAEKGFRISPKEKKELSIAMLGEFEHGTRRVALASGNGQETYLAAMMPWES